MNIQKLLRKEIDRLEKILSQCENTIKHLQKGKLRCSSSHGTHQYYIDGIYIPKKKKYCAEKVAQREYYEKLIVVTKELLEKVKELEHLYRNKGIESVYNSLCMGRKELIQPGEETAAGRIKKFMSVEYEPGSFDSDNQTEYYTAKGERVRSKSEMIIADELYRRGIPYHYEKPLQLKDRGRTVTIRPDFTVLNVNNGNVFILEHLGMMDDENYVLHNMDKLDLYEKNGFLLGKNLIITHETKKSPLSKTTIDTYIEEFFVS